MLKHVLTSKCNLNCSYCISRNVNITEQHGIHGVVDRYMEFYKKGHREIMLTGGEPSISKWFPMYISIARQVFERVFITTHNPEIIQHRWYSNAFDSITFLILDDVIPEVTNGSTVYASVLNVRPGIEEELKAKGYAGLANNENDDTPMIMPDLSIRLTFEK